MSADVATLLKRLEEFEKNPKLITEQNFAQLKEEIIQNLQGGYKSRFAKLSLVSGNDDDGFEDIPF